MNDRTLKNDRPLKTVFKTLLTVSIGVILSGCSTTSETFDCKAGKGVGCKSISQVNKMVDEGSLGAEQEERSHTLLSAPVITTASLSPGSPGYQGPDIALSDDMVVHRIREEHLRVWIAPFQDQQGNLHEGTVVHTVLKPGFWQIRGGE